MQIQKVLFILLLQFLSACLFAEDLKTNVLLEYALKKEAELSGADVVYRLSFMPEIGSNIKDVMPFGLTQSIKIFLKKSGDQGSASFDGSIILKILKENGGIFERKRRLSHEEVNNLVRSFFYQEVFSLPENQNYTDDLGRRNSVMDASIAKLERFDSRTGVESLVVRQSDESGPFTIITSRIHDLVQLWFEEFSREKGRMP